MPAQEEQIKMKIVAGFIFLLIAIGVNAQLPGENAAYNSDVFSRLEQVSSNQGIIAIEQSARMRALVNTHIDMNKRAGGVEGFRVQLYSGVGSKARQEALDAKGKVLADLPEENVFIEYSAPFWRVRVGNFRHKHEALPLLNKLKKIFPACYVVKVSDVPLRSLK
ncbi:SPOR domain-containing protein [Marinilabilia salmonicolor]|uniref:SPOR domain-containing protein n=2 Tax=Marinilabilia salmonicolor TaxID=989 RepID=UPI00029A8575|nr:SPOR domain-containing protein [Marinilabilia salmonicolor]